MIDVVRKSVAAFPQDSSQYVPSLALPVFRVFQSLSDEVLTLGIFDDDVRNLLLLLVVEKAVTLHHQLSHSGTAVLAHCGSPVFALDLAVEAVVQIKVESPCVLVVKFARVSMRFRNLQYGADCVYHIERTLVDELGNLLVLRADYASWTCCLNLGRVLQVQVFSLVCILLTVGLNCLWYVFILV